jgi:hypothetical protein
MEKLKTRLTLSFTIICLMILSLNIYSQNKQKKDSILLSVRVKDKWGYIDKTGKIQIKPQFDWAETFEQGISKVTVGDKIGYINKNGKYIWNPS